MLDSKLTLEASLFTLTFEQEEGKQGKLERNRYMINRVKQ